MNAQDKVYLKHNMITETALDQTGDNEQRKVKLDAAVVDGDQNTISFVEQYIKLWSDISRKKVAEIHKKSNKGIRIKKL